MKNLREQIKSRNFKRIYLLYGEEAYLKKLYRDRIKAAVLDGGDEMNYSHFENNLNDFSELIATAETMPFFSDKRIIIAENTGLFKNANDLADYIPRMPDTSVIVFIENEVDKRGRLFKAVKEYGYTVEFSTMENNELRQFTATYLGKAGKKITVADCDYLLITVGSDVLNLINELEKLISYVGEHNVITSSDIDIVCTAKIENKIFDMIEAIGVKNRSKAMQLYFDLIMLKEKPLTILYLIRKNFDKLLLICEMTNEHRADDYIALKVGIPKWAVKKYRAQLKNYNKSLLATAVSEATELEEQIKTGVIDERMALEIMLANQTRV